MYNLNYLELFILNTLIYFDLFDYPLTLTEIHDFLYTGGMEGGSFSLPEIKECLNSSEKLKKIIATESGFYFLSGRQANILTRQERYNLADQKFKIAFKALKFLQYLPFVKLIAICNNLAWSNAKKESDIDFFIITAKNRLWLVRFFSILIISLLGLRPPKDKARDKICLSFYTVEDNLDLNQVKISSEDIYLVFWLATLWPAYDRENCYAQLAESNLWLKKYLPNWQKIQPGLRRRLADNQINTFFYQTKEYFLSGFLGDWLENLLKQIQLDHMAQKKKDLAVLADNRVIISDQMLKFHENDRRAEYLKKFEEKREELLKNL